LKPKPVSLEGDVYTVETKKFTAFVRIGAETCEIKEYDVKPKSEEGFFVSFSPKLMLTVLLVSAVVNAGLYFGFKMFGL
jgi:hypothetical protein